MKKLIITAILLLPFLLFAQENKKTLIHAGKFFNSETGTFQSNIAIIISNNKIDIVKPFKEVSEVEQKEYTFIDLSKYTILPGLIDAHTHLLLKETIIPNNYFSGLDMLKTVVMEGDAYRAIYGSVRAKAYLEAGITAVQDLGNSGQYADIALRKTINEGLVIGPRMRCAGRGLSSEGGQIPDVIYKHRSIINDEYRIVTGEDDATQAVRENITQGASVIKIYSNNTPNVTSLSVEEMKAIVKEAHRYGIRVTAHATDNQAVYNAVISGVDGIEHGYEVEDSTFVLMAKKGLIFTATDLDDKCRKLCTKMDYPEGNWEAQANNWGNSNKARLQQAMKNGVIIAYGSDDYLDLKLPLAEHID